MQIVGMPDTEDKPKVKDVRDECFMLIGRNDVFMRMEGVRSSGSGLSVFNLSMKMTQIVQLDAPVQQYCNAQLDLDPLPEDAKQAARNMLASQITEDISMILSDWEYHVTYHAGKLNPSVTAAAVKTSKELMAKMRKKYLGVVRDEDVIKEDN